MAVLCSNLKQAGRICALAGQTEKAVQYYRKALQWGGDDEDVRQALESLSGPASSRRGLFGRVS